MTVTSQSVRTAMSNAALAVILCLAPPTSEPGEAQIKTDTSAYPTSTCLQYGFRGEEPPDSVSTAVANAVADCVQRLLARLRSLGSADSIDVPAVPPLPERKISRARFLIEAHRDYEAYKKWFSKTRPTHAQRLGIETLADEVHDLMDRIGLRQPFSAVLVSGPVLSFANETAEAGTDDDADKRALAYIAWESRHFGKDGRVDGSVAGRFGFQPSLTLVEQSEAGTTDSTAQGEEDDKVGDDKPTGHFQNAFVWDLQARLNVHGGSDDRGEFSGAFRAGQVILFNETSLVQSGGQSFLAVPVDNGAGRAAWFFDLGIEYNRYAGEVRDLHDGGGLLNPLAHISFGVSYNRRFRMADPVPSGQMEAETDQMMGSQQVAMEEERALGDFEDPEWRYFFRFLLDALNIQDLRSGSDERKTFTIGFGVEYEGGRDVPSTTRLLFRGDVDLLNALRGGS